MIQDSLKRIGEASLLQDGTKMIAPFKRKRRTIAVDPGIRDHFRLIQSGVYVGFARSFLHQADGLSSDIVMRVGVNIA